MERSEARAAQAAGWIGFDEGRVTKTYHAIVCRISLQTWVCGTHLHKNPADAPLTTQTTSERL